MCPLRGAEGMPRAGGPRKGDSAFGFVCISHNRKLIQCYLTTLEDDPASRNLCIEETYLSPAHFVGQDQEIDVVFALAAGA